MDVGNGSGAEREELRRLREEAARLEGERDEMSARYEKARGEASEARRRLEAVTRSSREFTRSARSTLAGQHGFENELRESLSRARIDRSESEESRRRVEDLIDRIGGGVWEAEVSPEAGIELFTFVSKSFEETMGYPRSRWLRSARFWFEAMHPEDRERVRAAYAKAARDGEPGQVEFRAFAADGSLAWIQDVFQPMEKDSGHPGNERLEDGHARDRRTGNGHSEGGGSEGGRVEDGRAGNVRAEIGHARDGEIESGHSGGGRPRLFGLITDMTARRRTEEALRESEERFRLLFEQATEAVFVHDIEGGITQVNKQACESLGHTREELLGMSVADIETTPAPGGFERQWREVARTGNPVFVEGAHRRKDGSTFPVEVSVGRFEGDGEPSMLALARDVTERRRAEDEREAALESERRARGQIAFLADASRELASFLDLDETLARAARLAVPHVAEWCVVSVLDDLDGAGGGHRHRLAVSFQTEDGGVDVRHESRLDDEAPEPIREVVRTGEPRLVEKVDGAHLEEISAGEGHLERLRNFGLGSYAIAPLEARGRTFGTITFARNDPSRRYDRESLDLLGNFADRAALALENSRLFERQRHTARVLQKSLLPADLPEIPGLDAAARLKPLGEGVEVGGDFYDLFHASEGRWAVAIGDVLGKGPEAASVTALARYTLRSEARHERVPSSVLEALNEAMLEQRPAADDRFCTVLYGNVHPKPGGFDLEFASGGHPLPVALRSDGSVAEVGRHGTLLGVFDDPELFDSKVDLGRGDAVVFYTDGVTEARNEGELFGEERVREAVASCAGRGADAIADCLEASLHKFSGGVLGDDAAILVIKASE